MDFFKIGKTGLAEEGTLALILQAVVPKEFPADGTSRRVNNIYELAQYVQCLGNSFLHPLPNPPPRRGWKGISAKLLCKHSQVAFMPYGLVSRDERRTSNIERPITPRREIKNKHPIMRYEAYG